jgi:hypothetical protein
VLSIDGLQPEKGHETLYVVRELNARRAWFSARRSARSDRWWSSTARLAANPGSMRRSGSGTIKDAMDEPANTVYLVTIVGPWVTWRDLGAGTTYYADIIVSGSIVPGHEPRFSATQDSERCVVSWQREPSASPFRDRAVRAALSHGDHFEIGDTTYLVYVEDSAAWWADAPAVADARDAAVLDELRQLQDHALVVAARRFLALPYTSAWWSAEFDSRTGFVQYRDGRVPRPRACKVAFVDNAVRLRWDVAIWDLAKQAWAAGREQASFERDVTGRSLVTLLDCATRLVGIPFA